MAAAAGRKKSIISSAGLQIDTPIANNTVLNQGAISSLYQECSRLRARLMSVRGFQDYFQLCNAQNSRQSTDPVTQLWDLFSFGIPLCYIFDQLPEDEGFSRINNSGFNQEQFDANPDRAKKHAIALFAMQIRSERVKQNIQKCELFTVTDLWDRTSNDGLVKVSILGLVLRPSLHPISGCQDRQGHRQPSTPNCFRRCPSLATIFIHAGLSGFLRR
jgi:cell division control protein 24